MDENYELESHQQSLDDQYVNTLAYMEWVAEVMGALLPTKHLVIQRAKRDNFDLTDEEAGRIITQMKKEFPHDPWHLTEDHN